MRGAGGGVMRSLLEEGEEEEEEEEGSRLGGSRMGWSTYLARKLSIVACVGEGGMVGRARGGGEPLMKTR